MKFPILFSAAILTTFCFAPVVCAQNAAPAKTLLEMNDDALKRLTPSSTQVTVARSADAAMPGLVVTIAPGQEGYPGISIKPDGASWDLSNFGHVEARVVNSGAKPLSLSLRVDNDGNWQDNPWNTESATLKPGEAGSVTTIFGYSYGRKPGYALKSSAVSNILFFAGKSDEAQSFRIESLTASGPAGETPPVDPDSLRVKPQNGSLLGAGVAIDGAKSAQAWLDGPQNTLNIVFQGSKDEPSVALKPAVGRWDLREALQVRVKVRNTGKVPLTPRVRVESNGGPSDWSVGMPLAPGANGEIIVPFISPTTADLSKKGTGNRVTNDAVGAITFGGEKADAERTLIVESIKAEVPVQQLPNWLGKRPPVDGDWVKTLDDEFNGTALDASIWDIYGPNYWDKQSHWSKDNVILGGGVVKLRYEKKTGFHDDDPTKKQTDWQSGYLHTYDKWVQKYGYFEARMKLPKAPGLWPAFWMMPDRGRDAKNRQDTGNGGMEFDIMEHLTRWGGLRYNITMHYDGYDKDHKSIGADKIYAQPDKDGFITCGLLWTPGSAIYYANGVEVLRWQDPRISNVPQMLMFTLPMGGWDNNALDIKQLPDDFIIDYVRVWQRKDLASATDGKMPAIAK